MVGRVEGRVAAGAVLANLAGIDDRDAAGAWVGAEIAVPRGVLPAAGPGEYYWFQLQGLVVVNRQGIELGTVEHLIETGANDVLVVRACEGSIDDRERLIPYLPGDVVTRVDLEQGVIEVDWYIDV